MTLTKPATLYNFTSRQRKILFAAIAILIVSLFAVDFFNPFIPSMEHDLATNQLTMKYLIVSYMLVSGIAQLIYGSLSDRYGRKNSLIQGFLIAAVGVFIGFVATHIAWFFIGRIITAIGIATGVVNARAIIVDTFPPPQQLAKAFSYFAMAAQLSPAFSPVIAAYLGKYFGWQGEFLGFSVVLLFFVIICRRLLPETLAPEQRTPWEEKLSAWHQLLSNASFLRLSCASGLILAFILGFYGLAPFAFHQLGLNSQRISLYYLEFAIILFIGSFCTTQLAKSSLSINWQFYACCLGLLAWFWLCFFTHLPDNSLWGRHLFIAVTAFFTGLAGPLAMTLCMSEVGKYRGVASGLQGALRMLVSGGSLLGISKIKIVNFTAISAVFAVIAIFLVTIICWEFFRTPQKVTR